MKYYITYDSKHTKSYYVSPKIWGAGTSPERSHQNALDIIDGRYEKVIKGLKTIECSKLLYEELISYDMSEIDFPWFIDSSNKADFLEEVDWEGITAQYSKAQRIKILKKAIDYFQSILNKELGVKQ